MPLYGEQRHRFRSPYLGEWHGGRQGEDRRHQDSPVPKDRERRTIILRPRGILSSIHQGFLQARRTNVPTIEERREIRVRGKVQEILRRFEREAMLRANYQGAELGAPFRNLSL